jgi:DNA repair exonuclease SbcCD nuclease subunit
VTVFLHSGDWQLGMRRRYLGEDAQARFDEARTAAIARIGEIAARERCACVLVAGDVFESNAVDRRTVARALEALSAVPVPVVLLPGNHDPLDGASVWESQAFRSQCPPHVHVLRSAAPLAIADDLEVAGAVWRSRRPDHDLLAEALAELPPPSAATRVMLAHGAVDARFPERSDPAVIALSVAERALADGRIHYLALGDHHSTAAVGSSGRIHYAGAPEPTDFDEALPGQVLVVDADARRCEVRPVRVARWRFERRSRVPLAGAADLDALGAWLDGQPDKAQAVLRLSFEGTLDLRGRARLEALLERARDLFACVDVQDADSELAVLPDDGDFEALALSGFAAKAVERLRSASPDDGARDALALLVRLAGRAP